MTGPELRRLQAKRDRSRKQAKADEKALRDAIVQAVAEGKTHRWVAAELGVTHGRVGTVVAREAKRVA